MGETIKGMGYTPGLAPTADYIAIKMPVFSFEKLRGAEISMVRFTRHLRVRESNFLSTSR